MANIRRLQAARRLAWRALVRTVRTVTFLVLVIVGAIAGGAVWLQTRILSQLPQDLSEFKSYRPPSSCTVLTTDGTEIDQFYLERRIWVPLSELPAHVWQAFVASEDRRFLSHPGVDLFGVLRALWANMRGGVVVQGGSTLTQQLVKNLLVGKERSYDRKIKEAVLAYRLERELGKNDILELYVNYVYLGAGNYGVEAAARDYFGVSARQLDAGQAALLAGLVPAPSRYSPRTHPTAAAERRRRALKRMVAEGFVSESDARPLFDAPVLNVVEAPAAREVSTAYVTQVRREIRRLLGADLPFRMGLRVFVPLDLGIARTAQEAIRQALFELEQRQGKRAVVSHLERETHDAFLAQASGLARRLTNAQPMPPQPGHCFVALSLGPSGVMRAGPFTFTLSASSEETAALQTGDVVRVCAAQQPGEVRFDARPWAEGAAIVLENATGRVVAMVGGYAVSLEGLVRATQSRRQPGSSFKAYVYAAALARGRSQLDPILDAPLSLPAGGGKVWSPQNYTEKFLGEITLRTALAQSINTSAVRLAIETGPAEVTRVAQAMGVRTPLRSDLTVALGSSEVTPLDQALGYATIARLGVPTDPVFIDRIEDSRGQAFAQAGGRIVVAGEDLGQLPGGPQKRVLPAGAAYELTDMLREVVRTGTGRAAFKEGVDRAGKTGTTNDYVDAWFVGFTPRFTVAVWIGSDGPSSLGEKETGGRTALPAWVKIVDALPQPPTERFAVPDDATLVPWQTGWIGLARGKTPTSVLWLPPLGDAPLPGFGQAMAPVQPQTTATPEN
ncbi:MAG: penicillin-binding protein 1A [Myxococcaceae bacterium]